ncbi:MAG: hypothetical protein EA383_00380 [Spirochaetaceae bacterium]|nr:MAG: hypothetical protein EA383_00380 [Spirochaetaceae bacterium]
MYRLFLHAHDYGSIGPTRDSILRMNNAGAAKKPVLRLLCGTDTLFTSDKIVGRAAAAGSQVSKGAPGT